MTETYLTERGFRSWLLTRDHKRIGVMFLVGVSLSLFLGGLYAMFLRFELLSPGAILVTEETYNRFFTIHGVVMIFLFMVPSIPTVFGNFFLPIQIGARELAFPTLNLISFYVYLLGAFVTLSGMFIGGTDTGWTFYVPYASENAGSVVPVLIGVFILGISNIMTGINFIATLHTMRARGLTWNMVPLFSWAIYGTSIIQVLATPVLGMSLLLVAADAWFLLGIFNPDQGGDPILYQHLFWFYSHPAVYIMILPAMGVMSETVSTFSQEAPLSYRAIVLSTLGIAFVGFLTWGHHMFTSGMSMFDAAAFGLLSMFVAIFSAIKVFTWVGTMSGGSVDVKTPFLYFMAFIYLFVFGGMTGVAVATMSLDIHWHDTYFVVAHFHFIMVGGTVTGFLAALHYWFPKMTGRMYPERLGMAMAVLVFLGFNLTFVPQFLLGNAGMPRRYHHYPPEYQTLHVISSGGAVLLGVAFLVVLVYLLWALRRGPKTSANPWLSASYEWSTTSPPHKHNFARSPTFVTGPYDYGEIPPEEGRQVRYADG
jgi:cytochrome c oxidase subunit I